MIQSDYITLDENTYRFYYKDGLQYPSVTTIIGYGEDKSWLDRQKESIGPERVKLELEYASKRGTLFHDLMEYSMVNKVYDQNKLFEAFNPIGYTDEHIAGAKHLYEGMLESDFLETIKEVISTEQAIHCWVKGFGYGGRYDMIARDVWDNVFLLDFKSSKKPKLESQITGYYEQLSAYWYALEKLHGFKIAYAQDVIVDDQTKQLNIFRINKEKAKEHFKNFCQKGINFYQDVIPKINKDVKFSL